MLPSREGRGQPRLGLLLLPGGLLSELTPGPWKAPRPETPPSRTVLWKAAQVLASGVADSLSYADQRDPPAPATRPATMLQPVEDAGVLAPRFHSNVQPQTSPPVLKSPPPIFCIIWLCILFPY